MLTGPRQVGKTHLLLEVTRQWGDRAIYLAADAPEAALPGWWEAQWRRATQQARTAPAVLLLDEVHYLPDWSRRVKAAADQVHREQIPLHMVITGSAALQVGQGARETMAWSCSRKPIWSGPCRSTRRASCGAGPRRPSSCRCPMPSWPRPVLASRR
ncbi:MAG: AAA family ATPase, partial [Candidatus Latescibacterota bacterium]